MSAEELARSDAEPGRHGQRLPQDLVFPLRGTYVPRDHGYLLYAAVCAALPPAHGAGWLGIHPIAGERRPGERRDLLALTHRSRLILRAPPCHLAAVRTLAGRTLTLRYDRTDYAVALGPAEVRTLRPAPRLQARQVSYLLEKPCRYPTGGIDKAWLYDEFLSRITDDLRRLGGSARFRLGPINVVTLHRHRFLGAAVHLWALPREGSLRIQAQGLGWHRALGVGLFLPVAAQEPKESCR